MKEDPYFPAQNTSKPGFKIKGGTALGAIPNIINITEGPQHIRSDLQMSPENVAAVLKRTRPLNVTDVKTFLDYVKYHHSHIEKYAEVAAPLYALTGKKKQLSGSLSMKKLLRI